MPTQSRAAFAARRRAHRLRFGVLTAATVLCAWSASSSAQVTPVGSEFRVNTSTTSDQGYPSVAGLADGGFVVAWERESGGSGADGVFSQRYDVTGLAVGMEFQINSSTATNARHPRVAALTDGGFVIVYQQNGAVLGRRYDSASMPLAAAFQVDAGAGYPAVAGLKDGGFVATWADGDIFGRRYDSLGAPVEGAFQINTYTTGNQIRPKIAPAGSGFVVVWDSTPPALGTGQDGDEEGVFGRRYFANGPPDVEFQVNTTTANDQFAPDVAAAGGGFVAVWQSFGVFGQRYNGVGAPVGAEFPVHDMSFNGHPEVDGSPGGTFVVAYESYGADGGGYAVLGLRVPDVGLGSSFQANTFTAGHQRLPDVAVTGNGFVVVWESANQDGSGTGVYAQRFLFGPTLIFAEADDAIIKIFDKGSDAERRMVFVVRDPRLGTSPGAGIDPIRHGAALQVYNTAGTGDHACFALPSQGWRRLRDPSIVAYADKRFVDGACKVARIEDGTKLKVVCHAKAQALPYTPRRGTAGKPGGAVRERLDDIL